MSDASRRGSYSILPLIPPAAHVDTLTNAGVPCPFAEAVAELVACFRSGRVSPQGDRAVFGTTTVDDILPSLVGAS